jgi:predicted cobalt transporter CbtA
MVGALLVRGMLAGLLAGLLAFGFARTFGEPQVERAITFEAQHESADEPQPVSRETQRGVGLFVGVVVYGAAFGGLFALVFSLVHNRLGPLSPRATSLLLAFAAFLTLVLIPTIKYPASPPAVGAPETITLRTRLFFLMIFGAIAAAFVAVRLAQGLARRLGSWNAGIVGGAVFLVFVAALIVLMPSVDEVPADFPATVLWRFRLASLGTEAVIWTVLGLAFGALSERLLART